MSEEKKIKEFIKDPVELRIYGREVKLNRPTYRQSVRIAQMQKQDTTDAGEEVGKFLVECGLPADLLEEIEGHIVPQLLELLLEPKKK